MRDQIMGDYQLFTYTTTIAIFLAIETGLFTTGDVAVVAGSHIPFFLTDPMILLVKTGCLCAADLAFLTFLVDTTILVVESGVYLLATGMLALPFTILGKRTGSDAQQGDEGSGK
jgi:hypothetical protein